MTHKKPFAKRVLHSIDSPFSKPLYIDFPHCHFGAVTELSEMLPPGLQTSFCPNKPSLTTLKKKKKIKCAGSSIRPFSGLCCIPQGCLLPALAGPLCGAFGLCSKWKNRTEGAGSHFWSRDNPALNSDDTTGPRSLQAQGGEQPPYGRQWGSLHRPFPHPCHRQV